MGLVDHFDGEVDAVWGDTGPVDGFAVRDLRDAGLATVRVVVVDGSHGFAY